MKASSLKTIRFGKILLILALVGCVNIVINFPAAEVKDAARRIERDIRSGEPGDIKKDNALPPQSHNLRSLPPVTIGLLVVEAADLSVDSPVIRAVKVSRRARFPQLKPYLDDGTLGEGNKGFIVIRSVEGLDARARVTLKQLIDAENQDRANLFAEFNRLNNLNDLNAVQKQFGRAIRDELTPGQWYEDDNGNWVQKR